MTTCAVETCPRTAFRWRLCVPHALTWLLTPGSRGGPERDERLSAFIARQNVRRELARDARMSQSVDTEES